MTGRYSSFNASRDGQSILGPAPATPGPVLGTGDRAIGGGMGGGAPPLLSRAQYQTPGTTNPSAVPGGLNAGNLGQILRTLGISGAGGGGMGGAGGRAPGGIGPGQTAAESGQQFGAENAAVHPSVRSAVQLAGMVMNPATGLPAQLAMAAFPGLANVFGALGLPSASGFNVPGPQLTPAQQQQINMAYQQYGPAFAQSLLHSLRMMRATPTVTSMPGLAGPNFANPGFSITRTGSTPLTDAQIAAEIGAYAPSWGGPGTAAGGGAGNLGGSGDAGSGGLGGGVGGGPAGGQNRSM